MAKLSEVAPTGYDMYEKFFASCYRQGERTVYALDWSVRELVAFLPRPDPDKPLDNDATQRRIIPAHAKSFGEYVRTEREWVSPALLLNAPDIFKFDAIEDLDTGSTKFGLLMVPKDAKGEITIGDGQHRTLGFHLAWEHLNEAIRKKRELVHQTKQYGEANALQHAEAELDKLLQRRDALSKERVSVQIIVVSSATSARRIFVDINDNAKGVTGAVRSRFDDRKVVNRALNIILKESNFLDHRVDLEKDRTNGNSPFLLGAKHVADILRHLQVGAGRIGKRLEAELNENFVASEFNRFTKTLTGAFPPLAELEDGKITAPELRSVSLVGSNVMLRGLAIAWHDLHQQGWSDDEVQAAFAGLAPHLAAPVVADPEDTWFATGLFNSTENGAYSPTSRIQDLRALGEFIVKACTDENLAWTRVSTN